MSDFVADDDIDEDLRKKRKRSRKQKDSSSDWEDSGDEEYSEGSAFSESDDVLDDTVRSDESIDSEDDDGEPAVNVISDDDDDDDSNDGKSSSDGESVSSTEEFLQKRKKKSLKKIQHRVTSSTWWKTNKEPLSKSTRKRRAQRRDGGKSDNSDGDLSRPQKHKKRRSTISDDNDDDNYRPSCSRSSRDKTKPTEVKKKRKPKPKRTPVIDDEDDSDDEKESTAPTEQRQREDDDTSRQNGTPKSIGENESGENGTDDEDKSGSPTSSNENNGESPIVARVKRRKSKQAAVASSDENETEICKSSTTRLDSQELQDVQHSSQDKNANLCQSTSSDAVQCSQSETLNKLLEDDDADSSNLEGNDVNEICDIIEDCEPNSGTVNEVDLPAATTTAVQNEGQNSTGNESDLDFRRNEETEIESNVSLSNKDDELNKELQHSGATDKEAEMAGQELPEKDSQELSTKKVDKEAVTNDADKEEDKTSGIPEKQAIADDGSEVNAGVTDTSSANVSEDTIQSTSGEVTRDRKDDQVEDKKDETANATEGDNYDSDDSIVECAVPVKTPPPEITLSSDEEEPVPVSTTVNTTTSSATSMFGTAPTSSAFRQYPAFGPFSGRTTMNNPFQQNNSATSSIAEALSRSSASMSNNPFGQVLSRGFGMHQNLPQQQGSASRSGSQNVAQQSLFNRSNSGNVVNARQQPWRSWPSQVSSNSQQRQMGVSTSVQRPQALSQAQTGPRMTMMHGTSASSAGNYGIVQNQNPRMQASHSQVPFSGTSNRTAFQSASSSSAPQQFQQNSNIISQQTWGRTPNTVGQNRGQTWGRTQNTVQMGQTNSLFQRQVMQMRASNSNQRFNQPGRLEILGVSDGNRQPNHQNNPAQMNRLQSPSGSVQPSSFASGSSQSNMQTAQQTHFSGNPFSSHRQGNYNQQSFASSNNSQLQNRTPVHSDHRSSGTGFAPVSPFGAASTRHASSAANPSQHTGLSNNFGLQRHGLASVGNPGRFPGPARNGVVSGNVASTAFNRNDGATDRLQMLKTRMQQQQHQQQQQQLQNVNQSTFGGVKVIFDQQRNRWVQHSSFSGAFGQSQQHAELSSSMNSSSVPRSSLPIRPSSFQRSLVASGSGQMQPGSNMQQPTVTSSFSTHLPANVSSFGNMSSAQNIQGQRLGLQNPAISLPASVTQASSRTVQQVSASTGSMGHFVQEAYQHLHEHRRTFESACNNIQDNVRAMKNIQDEMRSMVEKSSSSSGKEVAMFSQTIISEVSTVRVDPSGGNMLSDIDSLPSNGLDVDPLGGNMLTDIDDAVLASIADEQEQNDKAGTTDSGGFVVDLDDPLSTIGNDPLVSLGEDELLMPLSGQDPASQGAPCEYVHDMASDSNNDVQTLTSSRDQHSRNCNDLEMPKRTPVVILRDILSQIKSVRFGEHSSGGQSLQHHRGPEPISVDICPGTKFTIKEKTNNGGVDLIDQSSKTVIELESSQAQHAERSKRIVDSECLDRSKQTATVVINRLNIQNTESDLIAEQLDEENHSGSMVSMQDSNSSVRESDKDSSINSIGSNQRLDDQTASSIHVKDESHPLPCENEAGDDGAEKKTSLQIPPVM